MKPASNDLDWLAFRYVAGELPDDEAASFESLLADDQAARDAVVQAVELSQTILAAQVQSPKHVALASAPRNWSTQFTLIACGTAACLLIALAINFSANNPSRPRLSDDLVNAWNLQLEESSDATATEDPTDADEAEFITADAPSWMVDAVRSLNGLKPSDEDETDAPETMES